MMSEKRTTFFRRLGSTLGLWALIVGAVLAGYDGGYFLLILFVDRKSVV